MIDPILININRLFVVSVKNGDDDDSTRKCCNNYYTLLVEIKYLMR